MLFYNILRKHEIKIMRTNALLLILLLITFTVLNACNVGKRKIHTRQESNKCSCTVRYNSPTHTNITVDPYCKCDSSSFETIKKMPYNYTAGICNTMHMDLSSACVKCSMCIAIANEIYLTLLEVHDLMGPDDWLSDEEIVPLFRTICDHFFRHYSLREIDGERFISDPSPGDRLITSSADGLWEENLKNMCHEYLDEIQELHLYEKWKEWCEIDENDEDDDSYLENILCRNEISTLRDCRGMNNAYKRQRPSKVYGVRVKILAEYNIFN